MFVYAITNLVNFKVYIGVSVNVERRWREHTSGHGSKVLKQAFDKYGVENFSFDILHEGSDELMLAMEKMLIRSLNCQGKGGYNIHEGGGTTSLGLRHTSETKKKMSLSHLRYVAKFGSRKHTDESKELMSELAKKRPPRVATIVLDGKPYHNIKLAAKELGLTRSCLKARIRRQRLRGVSEDKLLSDPRTTCTLR